MRLCHPTEQPSVEETHDACAQQCESLIMRKIYSADAYNNNNAITLIAFADMRVQKSEFVPMFPDLMHNKRDEHLRTFRMSSSSSTLHKFYSEHVNRAAFIIAHRAGQIARGVKYL